MDNLTTYLYRNNYVSVGEFKCINYRYNDTYLGQYEAVLIPLLMNLTDKNDKISYQFDNSKQIKFGYIIDIRPFQENPLMGRFFSFEQLALYLMEIKDNHLTDENNYFFQYMDKTMLVKYRHKIYMCEVVPNINDITPSYTFRLIVL